MSRLLHIVLALASVSAVAALAHGKHEGASDAVARREAQFKAAYVFNFLKFVEWPAGAMAADTLTVCFAGGASVHDALSTEIENKHVGARRLLAQRLTIEAPAEQCDALYLDAATVVNYTPDYATATLTISDAQGFVAQGGMIELFTQNHRLRFIVNTYGAQQAGLRVSSDLLKLAARVQREAP